MKYISISFLLTLIVSMSAAEIENLAPPEVQNIYMTLIAATSENNLDKFHSVCDPTLKAGLTKEKLKAVSESFVKNRKIGDDGKYLGFYSQRNGIVYMYKVATQDSSVDYLVTVSVANNQCNGFYIR